MPAISEKQLYNLLELLYEAARENSPEVWLKVYKQIAEAISSGPGTLSVYLNDKDEYKIICATLDPSDAVRYNQYYQHVNPFREQIRQLKTGELFNRQENYDDREFLNTELYQDFLRKQEAFYFIHQIIFKNEAISAGVFFSRPFGMENFSESETEVIRFLLPHLRRAFEINLLVTEINRDKRIILDILDKSSQSVVVLNKAGKIVLLNDGANKIISEKDGLQLDRNGALVATLAQDTKKLRELLQGVFEPNINHNTIHGGFMQIPRSDGKRPLSLLVAPFVEQNYINQSAETFALLFINDPEQNVETVEQIVAQMYNLTPAESRLAAMLTQGVSLTDASARLGVSQNTVRTHLKRIFSKTETNRQSELVKLILNSSANLKK